MTQSQVVIIGAGASGLMCAIEAAKRGRGVLVVDHANKAGKKILMSGGGRCNFTNYDVSAQNYVSHNAHFCKSALSRFTQWDFIALVEKYRIPYHERDHGQLFCNETAKAILAMLLEECRLHHAKISLQHSIEKITVRPEGGFVLATSKEPLHCDALVVATGGLSIPKMGASPLGYRIAEQFGIAVRATRAGLVPFTYTEQDKARYGDLSGIAVAARVSFAGMQFRENILFTHRGLSGPAILQISSYWESGQAVTIDLLPDVDIAGEVARAASAKTSQIVRNFLAQWLPKRLLDVFFAEDMLNLPVKSLAFTSVKEIERSLQCWQFLPNGTEGYRTAEVTLGGVDCDAISSKTFEAKQVPGLYFVGEVLDVTGWLGGYNFQWAWSSGWCAGQYV